MINFLDDYNEISHPRILESITENNMVITEGYGEDIFCNEAKKLIKDRFDCEDSDIYFFVGGTATNLTAISYLIRSYHSIIATDTAHICVNEAGAIEATGRKINVIKNKHGKIDLEQTKKLYDTHMENHHMTIPKAIYISNSTELGTIYTKDELKDLWNFCQKNNLYLYMDGARLGSALTSKENNLDPKDIAKMTDMFYIGGTKNGSPLGEALIINNPKLRENFFTHMKQKGAVLAKGKIIGICFKELFKDDLFFDLAKHSNEMAYYIYDNIKETGIEFLEKPQSNQIFVILSEDKIEKISKDFMVTVEEKVEDNKRIVRFVTSWTTTKEEADILISAIKSLF